MAGMVTLLIVLGLALYVCWLMLQPFFNVLLWAVVLTVVFYPMHRRIRYTTGRPTLAAAISTLLVVLLIVLPVTFITIAVVRELTGAAANLRRGVQWLTDPNVPVHRLASGEGPQLRGHRSGLGEGIPRRTACRPGARFSRAARSSWSAAQSVPSPRWGWSYSRCSTCSATAPAPRRGLRDAAARARPDPFDHQSHGGRHRRDALWRARDFRRFRERSALSSSGRSASRHLFSGAS